MFDNPLVIVAAIVLVIVIVWAVRRGRKPKIQSWQKRGIKQGAAGPANVRLSSSVDAVPTWRPGPMAPAPEEPEDDDEPD